MPKSEDVSGLSMEQLKELILELRKPVKTEKEIREEKDYQDARLNMMQTIKTAEENKKLEQAACSHMRADGSTRAVFISDFGWYYCQKCAKWIKPNEDPETFNRLLQSERGE